MLLVDSAYWSKDYRTCIITTYLWLSRRFCDHLGCRSSLTSFEPSERSVTGASLLPSRTSGVHWLINDELHLRNLIFRRPFKMSFLSLNVVCIEFVGNCEYTKQTQFRPIFSQNATRSLIFTSANFVNFRLSNYCYKWLRVISFSGSLNFRNAYFASAVLLKWPSCYVWRVKCRRR